MFDIKFPFNIEPTFQNFIIIGMIILGIYLYMTNGLNRITGLIISGIVLFALLSQKKLPEKIDIIKAREITYDYLNSLQIENEIPQGRIRILPERELKHFLVAMGNESELIAYKYDILSEISGRIPTYFLVKVGAYGDISGKVVGISEIKSRKSITSIEPEIKTIEGKIITAEQEIKKETETEPKGE